MKTALLLLVMAQALIVEQAFGLVYTVTMTHSESSTVYLLDGKPCTLSELKALFRELASLDKDQFIWIRCFDSDRIIDVLPLLQVIQDSGLRNAQLSFFAKKDGKNGIQFMHLQVLPPAKEFRTCTGVVPLKDGFSASGEGLWVELPEKPTPQ